MTKAEIHMYDGDRQGRERMQDEAGQGQYV